MERKVLVGTVTLVCPYYIGYCFYRKVIKNLESLLLLDVVACYRKVTVANENTDLD